MATLITAFIVIWLLFLPVRIAMRHARARQRVVQPQVIVVVQQPAVPAAALTLEQELERIVAGSR
jgi:hypothetical protein